VASSSPRTKQGHHSYQTLVCNRKHTSCSLVKTTALLSFLVLKKY